MVNQVESSFPIGLIRKIPTLKLIQLGIIYFTQLATTTQLRNAEISTIYPQ